MQGRTTSKPRQASKRARPSERRVERLVPALPSSSCAPGNPGRKNPQLSEKLKEEVLVRVPGPLPAGGKDKVSQDHTLPTPTFADSGKQDLWQPSG